MCVCVFVIWFCFMELIVSIANLTSFRFYALCHLFYFCVRTMCFLATYTANYICNLCRLHCCNIKLLFSHSYTHGVKVFAFVGLFFFLSFGSAVSPRSVCTYISTFVSYVNRLPPSLSVMYTSFLVTRSLTELNVVQETTDLIVSQLHPTSCRQTNVWRH